MDTSKILSRASAILIAAVSFVLLFYQSRNNQGLNWLLYLIVLTTLASIFLRRSQTNHLYLTLAVPLIAGIGMMWHGTALAIAACIAAFLFLAARMTDAKLQAPEGIVVAGINLFLSPLVAFIRFIQRTSGKQKSSDKKILKWLIPLLLITAFGILYYHSSPVFRNLINRLDWPDLSEVIFMTIWGALMAVTVFKSFFPESLSVALRREPKEQSWSIFKSDYLQTWRITTILLSVLLLIVVFSDAWYRFIIHELPPELTLSEYLHQGFFSLIVTIVLTAFLGTRLLSQPDYKSDRFLRYTWLSFIGLNSIFILQTTARNLAYIQEFGLTEKRIAVYFYLFACFVSLFLAARTILRSDSIRTLYGQLSWMTIILFVSASLVNWSKVIMTYNLQNIPSSTAVIDYDYLLRLNRSSLTQLIPHADELTPKQQRKLRRRLNRNLSRETWQIEDPRGFVIDHYILLKELRDQTAFLTNDSSNTTGK
ncbi:MAG: DUF4173 domain-containing protein [Flavobacteriales bacterium]|nr:DUF4173 domain-containing protein [Bacteroidota bacterium]MCB9239811.1 DUF4173 domain-containing protein [Flavobacteriales bacterium]